MYKAWTRKDLIRILEERPWRADELAHLLQIKPAEVLEHLLHLEKTLRHMPYKMRVQPARCRRCGFEFSTRQLFKPGRCPKCRSTWIAAALVQIERVESSKEKTMGKESEVNGQAAKIELTNPVNQPDWVQWIDHTADAGFTVTAPQLPLLFQRAAQALFMMMTDLGTVRPLSERQVEVQAPDLEALLVRWLAELLYFHERYREFYSLFKIGSLDESSPSVQAQVLGEPVDPNRHPIYSEVKAVTYHGLYIKQNEQGMWEARIIVDV